MRSGSNHIRLDKTVQGGAGRREGGDIVVVPIGGGVIISESANRDDVGGVTGHTDTHRSGAAVAGSNDYSNPVRPGPHDGLVEGVSPVRRLHQSHQREVHDLDVIGVLVVNHPLNPLDDPAVRPVASPVQNSNSYQIDVGGHTIVFAIRAYHAVGDDACHVGSVTVGVFGPAFVPYEILPAHQAHCTIRAQQHAGMQADAGIHHRNRYAGAVIAFIPHQVCAGHVRRIRLRNAPAAQHLGGFLTVHAKGTLHAVSKRGHKVIIHTLGKDIRVKGEGVIVSIGDQAHGSIRSYSGNAGSRGQFLRLGYTQAGNHPVNQGQHGRDLASFRTDGRGDGSRAGALHNPRLGRAVCSPHGTRGAENTCHQHQYNGEGKDTLYFLHEAPPVNLLLRIPARHPGRALTTTGLEAPGLTDTRHPPPRTKEERQFALRQPGCLGETIGFAPPAHAGFAFSVQRDCNVINQLYCSRFPSCVNRKLQNLHKFNRLCAAMRVTLDQRMDEQNTPSDFSHTEPQRTRDILNLRVRRRQTTERYQFEIPSKAIIKHTCRGAIRGKLRPYVLPSNAPFGEQNTVHVTSISAPGAVRMSVPDSQNEAGA